MNRIAATSSGAISPAGDGGEAVGEAGGVDQGASVSMIDSVAVSAVARGELFGHRFGSEDHRFAFESVATNWASVNDPVELTKVLDAEYPPDAHGRTNIPAMRDAMFAAMEMMQGQPVIGAPHLTYGSAVDRFAEIMVQPDPLSDLAHADLVRERLDKWTRGLEATDPILSAAISQAVVHKQADMLAPHRTVPANLLDKAPPLAPSVISMLFGASAGAFARA